MTSRGFTLIELLTTIVIVGVLSVIGLKSYKKHTELTDATKAQNVLIEQAIMIAKSGAIPQGYALPSPIVRNGVNVYTFQFITDNLSVNRIEWVLAAQNSDSSGLSYSIDSEGYRCMVKGKIVTSYCLFGSQDKYDQKLEW